MLAKLRMMRTRQTVLRQMRREYGVRYRGYEPYRNSAWDLKYVVRQPPLRGTNG